MGPDSRWLGSFQKRWLPWKLSAVMWTATATQTPDLPRTAILGSPQSVTSPPLQSPSCPTSALDGLSIASQELFSDGAACGSIDQALQGWQPLCQHRHAYLWAVIDDMPSVRHIKHKYNRRKFRSETSDNMDSWNAEVRRVRREKVRRKKMQMREKVGKSRLTVFFQWFVAPEGRKVGSLKRRVRSQLARWEMKNCTPLWREAHFQVKMYKTPQLRTTFGSCDVEKVHAVVARSTFPSQNVQNTPWSDHFWKLRCRKIARRCGAKHISKSKCAKHLSSGPLLEVEMSKKCTPLWREAHFQVKSVKNWRSRTTFWSSDVEKSVEKMHAVVARSTFRSQKCKKLRVLSLFWREDVEKVDTD